MRLAAQAKLGFYPAHPRAVEGILKHLYLRKPNPDKPNDTLQIIDPCCGEGLAIRQIARGLGVPNSGVYTVELDGERCRRVAENILGGHHLGPASFAGVMITGFSFGLAYVNPPFDNELGGGRREEQAFAERATRLLVPHGVLVLVCPLKALAGNRPFVEFLDANYEDAAVYKFPDGDDPETGKPYRPYNEVVVIGNKRRQVLPADAPKHSCRLHQMNLQWSGYVEMRSLPEVGGVQPASWNGCHPSFDRETHVRAWEVPPAWRPNTFKKVTFTDQELIDQVKSSPLNRLLEEVVVPPPASPPLPLDKGHLGLILASGMLDGPVEGPHGVHVVRGSSEKREFHNREASESTENPETGAVTTKDVYSERMITTIRCVDHEGVIYTHSNAPEEKEKDEGLLDD